MGVMTGSGSVGAWKPTDETFGARLAAVRYAMGGWSVKEAAQECGIAVASWRSWERGRRPRNYIEVCLRVGRRTGVDVAWLAGLPELAHSA